MDGGSVQISARVDSGSNCCCVCGAYFRADQGTEQDTRFYCHLDFDRMQDATQVGLRHLGLFEIFLTLSFILSVGLVYGFHDHHAVGAVFGVLIAFGPPVLWTVFAYAQDRIDPEPLHLVAGLFLLGSLLGATFVYPLVMHFLDASWRQGGMAGVFQEVFIVSGLEQVTVLAAVMLMVYRSREFDEAIDAVVYCVAVGQGLIAALNGMVIIAHGGMFPFASATSVALQSMYQVAACLVLGYGVAKYRYSGSLPSLVLATGLSILINGGFHELVAYLSAHRGTINPKTALGIAAVLSVVVSVGAHILLAQLRNQIIFEYETGDSLPPESETLRT